jgi:predicted dehydrogenase
MGPKAKSARKIRVGFVNCDLHATWYAAFMQTPDPAALMRHHKIVHYYFYNMYDAEELVIPRVPGFEIVKAWSPERAHAERFAEIFRGRPAVCHTLEGASDDVDLVFVADCTGDGTEHLAWARPGLKKGVPTFVDKPLACTLRDAKAMVRLARRHKTPLLSLSLLSTSPAVTQFRERFKEIEPVVLGSVRGTGGWRGGALGAVIHALSLAQSCFGTGVEYVQCMGKTPLEYVHLHYPGDMNGTEVVCMNPPTVGPNCAAYASAYTRAHVGGRGFLHKKGAIHSDAVDDWAFIGGGKVMLDMVRKMVRTRKPPVPYDTMLELIRIVEAARVSQKTGKPVPLSRVR